MIYCAMLALLVGIGAYWLRWHLRHDALLDSLNRSAIAVASLFGMELIQAPWLPRDQILVLPRELVFEVDDVMSHSVRLDYDYKAHRAQILAEERFVLQLMTTSQGQIALGGVS